MSRLPWASYVVGNSTLGVMETFPLYVVRPAAVLYYPL
jgi:hypothetical protein